MNDRPKNSNIIGGNDPFWSTLEGAYQLYLHRGSMSPRRLFHYNYTPEGYSAVEEDLQQRFERFAYIYRKLNNAKRDREREKSYYR